MNEHNDEKLLKYLEANRPEAPTTPFGEWERIVRRLGLGVSPEKRKRRTFFYFGAGFGAIAASVLAVWMVLVKPIDLPGSTTTQVAALEFPEDGELMAFETFDIEEVNEEDLDLPSHVVGEEYLSLLAGQ